LTGSEFKFRRVECGYTQTECGALIGKSLRTVQRIEKDQTPIALLVADAMRRLEKRENDK
jgi:DNA-binding XRE family transcriptional regulator